MTDISNWPSTIHKRFEELDEEEIAKYKKIFPNHKGNFGSEYIMIPMDNSGYQMGNLLWFLRKHPEDSTGDWYQEIISIIQVACIKMKIVPRANIPGNEEYDKDIEWIKKKISEG